MLEKYLATMVQCVSGADQGTFAVRLKRGRFPVPCQDSIHSVELPNVRTVQLVMPVGIVAHFLSPVHWESMQMLRTYSAANSACLGGNVRRPLVPLKHAQQVWKHMLLKGWVHKGPMTNFDIFHSQIVFLESRKHSFTKVMTFL